MTDLKKSVEIGGRGPGILTLLAILFIALKLMGEIEFVLRWLFRFLFRKDQLPNHDAGTAETSPDEDGVLQD